jgi:hypothetical protein
MPIKRMMLTVMTFQAFSIGPVGAGVIVKETMGMQQSFFVATYEETYYKNTCNLQEKGPVIRSVIPTS